MKKKKEKAVEEEIDQTIDQETTNEQQEDIKAEDTPNPDEELKREKDKFLRLFAEFENYKARTNKERIELFKTAGQDIMQSMLPVMDDFDRAMKEIKNSDDNALYEGVQLIQNKLKNTLEMKGLSVMPVEAGETFDSEIHEAVTQIPAPSDDMKGKIIDVIEKGYKLGDKIIRYPKVVIGQQ